MTTNTTNIDVRCIDCDWTATRDEAERADALTFMECPDCYGSLRVES